MATDTNCSKCGKSGRIYIHADRWKCPHCGFESWDDPNWRNHRGETRQEEYENNLRFIESGGKDTGGHPVATCLGGLFGLLVVIALVVGCLFLISSCF